MAIDKIIDPNIAANAYAKNMGVTKATTGESGEAGGSGEGGGVKFSTFLKDKVQDSVETMKDSEKMSAQAVTGESNLTDVVQAVTEAELTLQTIVAVRDRMISAYQDIMRMPI